MRAEFRRTSAPNRARARDELLSQNLEQEKAALEQLQTIGRRLAKEGAKQKTRA